MFEFYFLDNDIEQNTSFHSNTNTLYYDNLSIRGVLRRVKISLRVLQYNIYYDI
jgi:hypothetical protein